MKSLMKKLIKFIEFQKKKNKMFSNKKKLYKIVIKEYYVFILGILLKGKGLGRKCRIIKRLFLG